MGLNPDRRFASLLWVAALFAFGCAGAQDAQAATTSLIRSYGASGKPGVAVTAFTVEAKALPQHRLALDVRVRASLRKGKRAALVLRAGACSRGPENDPTCPNAADVALPVVPEALTFSRRLVVRAPSSGRPVEIALTYPGHWKGVPNEAGRSIVRLKLTSEAWHLDPGTPFGLHRARVADSTGAPGLYRVGAYRFLERPLNDGARLTVDWQISGPADARLLTTTSPCEHSTSADCEDRAASTGLGGDGFARYTSVADLSAIGSEPLRVVVRPNDGATDTLDVRLPWAGAR